MGITGSFDILGVVFDPKMTFEKHLHLVSRATSHWFGILKSCRVLYLMTRSLMERCFGALSQLFWSTVLQCGAQLLIHI